VTADVGDDERGAGQPRNVSERVQVGCQDEVAVTGVPTRRLEPVDGVHVDVDGEQVVAALDAVIDHLVEEQPRRRPLADQAALHVTEADDHRVDLSCGRQVS